jgi:hypothetical protein
MKRSINRTMQFAILGAVGLTALAAVFVACSSDSAGLSDQSDSGTEDSGVDVSTADVSNSKDSPSSDSSNNTDSPLGTDGGEAGPALTPPGCFAGTPTTNAEIINACTNAQYVIIDNSARIGLCDGGMLPALVPPPVEAGTDAAPDAGATSDAGAD